MNKEINYMLYSNADDESLAYGDIKYITEHLRDYITGGKPENISIRPTQSSVLKAVREYNTKHSYGLGLYQHLE